LAEPRVLIIAGEIPLIVNEEDIEKEISEILYKYDFPTYLLNYLGIYSELNGQYYYGHLIMVNKVLKINN
jgi:hypothetical protein